MSSHRLVRVRAERALVGIAVALGMSAILLVGLLQTAAGHSGRGVQALDALSVSIAGQMAAPLGAAANVAPHAQARALAAGDRRIEAAFAGLRGDGADPTLGPLGRALTHSLVAERVVITRLDASRARRVTLAPAIVAALSAQESTYPALDRALRVAASRYASAVNADREETQLGLVGAIAVMLIAFLIVYQRSVQTRAEAERLAAENAELASQNEQEAMTDALTGLGNRRALMTALTDRCERLDEGPAMLALFDLDGFKQYNDVFGHPAGDALLQRLGERLSTQLPCGAVAYRMGGDEFCVLAELHGQDAVSIARACAAALVDRGERFEVTSSYGLAIAPTDSDRPAELLRAADQRMYASKVSRSRSAAGRQTVDALERLLAEQNGELAAESDEVAALAATTAQRLGLSKTEARHIELAARLHDIGKCAVPAGILDKPAPLDAEEWKLIRQHPVIGERIVNAAPAISHVAPLIRATHERLDGTGYPDGVSGDEIPRGAQIIAACAAFRAMTTRRPYRSAMTSEQAIAELRACAGTQFDPLVVDVLISTVAEAGGVV